MGEHAERQIPGTEEPRRFMPRFRWELLVCGVEGHELVGTDARELRPQDAHFARDLGGSRWFRCLRCDSWLPLQPPEAPAVEHPPEEAQIEVPLRGRALRDKVVLRLIAVDRVIHFLLLGAFAVLVLFLANDQATWRRIFFRAVGDQNGHAQPHDATLRKIQHVLTIDSGHLHEVAALAAGYALLEGVEAVGLWIGARWAEYLTLLATAILLPLEIYELANGASAFKVLAFVVNVAVVVYLLFAKRLFGLRGGAAAERAERDADTGWAALRRTAPAA